MFNEAHRGPHEIGIEELKRSWGWFLALGIGLIILGIAALGHSLVASLVMVSLFGWLLLVGGILAVAHAFLRRRWGGFFLDLFTGLLYSAVGVLIVDHPAESAAGLTLLIALSLLIGGAFRIVMALTVRFQHRVWMLCNGVISLLLGLMIWRQWPMSGLWVIGAFLGIDLIFYGWSLVMLGIGAKGLPDQAA
jgi:uncharacterized membrane protein HdeD (DUF308 family)